MARKKKRAAARPAARAPRKQGNKVMARIQSLKDAVQSAIDNGATTVQDVHQRIAAMPFDRLARFAAIEGLVERARGVHDRSVGAVYDTIRAINARVGELADEALKRLGQGGA